MDYDGLYAGFYNVLITGGIITAIFVAAIVRPLSIVQENNELNVIHT